MKKTIIGRTMSMAAMAGDLRTIRRTNDEAVRANARVDVIEPSRRKRWPPPRRAEGFGVSFDLPRIGVCYRTVVNRFGGACARRRNRI